MSGDSMKRIQVFSEFHKFNTRPQAVPRAMCICMNAALPIVVRLQVVSLMRNVPMLWLKVPLEAERIREVFCLAIGYGHSVKAELSYELQHPK